MLRTLVIVSACAVTLVFAAAAQSLSTRDIQPQDPAAGVARAKAAGIRIDAPAERAMLQAPIGSCFNDPTQSKCPPAHAVIAGSGSSSYAPLPAGP